MPSVTLSSLIGGGGTFKPSFFSGALQISAGVTGDILTLTAPSGKKVMLTGLIVSTGSAEANVTVSNEIGSVVSSKSLATTAALSSQPGSFIVGIGATAASEGGAVGLLPYVIGSTVTVSKSGGNTSQAIRYSYAYGD